MELSTLIDPIVAFGISLADGTVLDGDAGFLARFGISGLAFVALALSLRHAPIALRSPGLILGSIGLLGFLTTPAVATIFVLYLAVFYAAVEWLPRGHPRTAVLIALLVAQGIGPIFWLPELPGYTGHAREYFAFATNLTLIRFWGYAYDRSRRPEPERPRFVDYALFMLFFPAFVNGPIVSHVEFQQRKLDWFWKDGEHPGLLATLRSEAVAVRRTILGMALGLFTMAVIYVHRDSMYASAMSSGSSGWPYALYTYTWWYLSFTAWTEAAIGLAHLSGIRLPENFDAPHLAYGPADFWRRWNMTFMVWLRRYVYLPLGGAFVRGFDGERHLEWRNTFAVFGAVAAYHLLGGLKLLGPHWYSWTSCIPWLLWAVLNTAGVLATRNLKRPSRIGPVAALVVVATLLFSSFGHMTAQYPPNAPIRGMLTLFRGLILP